MAPKRKNRKRTISYCAACKYTDQHENISKHVKTDTHCANVEKWVIEKPAIPFILSAGTTFQAVQTQEIESLITEGLISP